jgi:hypothetical protein
MNFSSVKLRIRLNSFFYSCVILAYFMDSSGFLFYYYCTDSSDLMSFYYYKSLFSARTQYPSRARVTVLVSVSKENFTNAQKHWIQHIHKRMISCIVSLRGKLYVIDYGVSVHSAMHLALENVWETFRYLWYGYLFSLTNINLSLKVRIPAL